jgi:hypothetical protein
LLSSVIAVFAVESIVPPPAADSASRSARPLTLDNQLPHIVLVLALLLVANMVISAIYSGDSRQSFALTWCLLSMFSVVFIVLRLGTLRPMDNSGNGLLSQFNHRETDELIFEV